jgi:DNA-binding beta-propeller fold protein YncE
MFSHAFENIIEDNSGNILVADLDNMAIRKIDGKGNVSTFYRGNDWNNELRGPTAMAIHPTTGDLYVAEVWEHRISIIDQNGNLTRLLDSSSGEIVMDLETKQSLVSLEIL